METVFLACFLFGVLFTLGAAVLGMASHALPHLHGANAGDGAADASAGHDGYRGLPLFNLSSLMAFLMWFGAGGYVLLRFGSLPLVLALAGGAGAGVAGAFIVGLFLRFVLAGERVMNPRDYRLEGTIARVTVSIPAEGVGEIVFSKGGARRSEAARSLDGRPIPRETEVVIIDYERGIAAVQPWEQFVARSEGPSREGGIPSPNRDA